MSHHISIPPKVYPPLEALPTNLAANARYDRMKPTESRHNTRLFWAIAAVVGTALAGVGLIAGGGVMLSRAKIPLGIKDVGALWLGVSVLIGGTPGVAALVLSIPDWNKYHSDEEVERLSKTISALDLKSFKALKHRDNLYRFGIIPENLKDPIEALIQRMDAQEKIQSDLAIEYQGIKHKRNEFPEGFNNNNHWAFTPGSNATINNYDKATKELENIHAEWITLRNEQLVPNLPLPEQRLQS